MTQKPTGRQLRFRFMIPLLAIFILAFSAAAFGAQYYPVTITRPSQIPTLISQGKGLMHKTTADEVRFTFEVPERGWLFCKHSYPSGGVALNIYSDPQFTNEVAYARERDFGDGSESYCCSYLDGKATYYGRTGTLWSGNTNWLYMFFLPASSVLKATVSVSSDKALITCTTNEIVTDAGTTTYSFGKGKRTVRDITDGDDTMKSVATNTFEVTENGTYTVRVRSTEKEWTMFPMDVTVDVSGIVDEIKMDPVLANSISISGPDQVKAGETGQFTASVEPVNTTYKDYVWSVDNTDYATISQDGLLTAKEAGAGHYVEVKVGIKDRRNGNVYEERDKSVYIPEKPAVVINVTDLKINGAKESLRAGKTMQLKAVVTPSDATNSDVYWESSDEDYAIVNENGLVKAFTEGIGKTVTIRVVSDDAEDVSASVSFTITGLPPTKVSLDKKKATMNAGEGLQLMETVLPKKAYDKSVTWTSSNKKVAVVDADGYVIAKKAGKATITVKTVNKKTAKCVITVKNVKTIKVKDIVVSDFVGKPQLAKKKVSTVKKGEMNLSAREGMIMFKAPKAGTYSFTFSNLRPEKGAGGVSYNGFATFYNSSVFIMPIARVSTKGGKHPVLWLASKEGEQTYGSMKTRCLLSRTGKIKLKKNEVIFIYLSVGVSGKRSLVHLKIS